MWPENGITSQSVLSQGLVSKGRDDAFYHRGVWPSEGKDNVAIGSDGLAYLGLLELNKGA